MVRTPPSHGGNRGSTPRGVKLNEMKFDAKQANCFACVGDRRIKSYCEAMI